MGRHVSGDEWSPRRTAGAATFRRRRPRRVPVWVVTLVAAGTVLALASAGTLLGIKMLGNRYENAVRKQDLLGAAAKGRDGRVDPPRISGPMTFLLIGSDSRAGENANPDTPDGNVGAIQGERSDTIMLVHVPKSTDRAYLISIPRDSYLPIADKSGSPGAKNKINSAFARGGAPRLVQTLNSFTGGHIDYPVIVDFAAIHKMTDLVGGVDVIVDRTSHDPYRFMPPNSPYPVTPCEDTHGHRQRCVTFNAGRLHLDAQLAEYYVRQRKGLPGGDLDRAKRQQQYLRALLAKVAASSFLTNPLKFDQLVRTAASAVTVDKRMPVQSLAFSLKGIRTTNLTFMTLPIADDARIPGVGSVLLPDRARARELFTALNTDTLDQYVQKYPPNNVAHGV